MFFHTKRGAGNFAYFTLLIYKFPHVFLSILRKLFQIEIFKLPEIFISGVLVPEKKNEKILLHGNGSALYTGLPVRPDVSNYLSFFQRHFYEFEHKNAPKTSQNEF